MVPSEYKVPFNKPYLTGEEPLLIQEVFSQGKLSGNGPFTQKCHHFLQHEIGGKCLLTSSGTAALEMMALVLGIGPGDEVILPSYTFVSTASAFALRGAKLVFIDVREDFPVINEYQVEAAITPRTKAIVLVHYAGVSCNMKVLMGISERFQVPLLEDAAQGFGGRYRGKTLGSFGLMSAISFHETKNISSGEGGCLVINRADLVEKAEILWDKGTDRAAFFRGERSKYQWQELGSSFLPSEMTAALLWAQFRNLKAIMSMRKDAWSFYDDNLPDEEEFYRKPLIPDGAEHNGHGYFLIFRNESLRKSARQFLLDKGVLALTHYEPLHQSPYYLRENVVTQLPETEKVAKTLLRLPLYNEITPEEQLSVIRLLQQWKENILVKGEMDYSG